MNPILLYEFGKSRKKFVSTWTTTNAGVSATNQVKLPAISLGTYAFTVDWGDPLSPPESIAGFTAASTPHTYLSGPGTYTITIIGTFIGFQFANGGDCTKIIGVTSWGSLRVAAAAAFQGCSNLHLENVTDVLDLIGTPNLNNMFANCTVLTTIGRSNDWNTSAITLLQTTFGGCTNFNADINGWDTSAVTAMTSTFSGCSNFNKPLDNWKTGLVTNFSSMFSGASIFNKDISSWDVSKVTTFTSMFLTAAAFNNGGAPMGWTLNTVGNIVMTSMFANAPGFNQAVGGWDMSKVTNIATMFSGATGFDKPIGAWRLISLAPSSTTNFMLAKSALNFTQTNLDSIYNGWINVNLSTPQNINFSLAKQTQASIEGRALLTRTSTILSVTAVTGSAGTTGLVRITTAAQTLIDGNKVFISGLASVGAPDGAYVVDQQSTTQVDLVGTSYNNTTYVSGGNMRTGFGWTIADGLLTITAVAQGGTNGAGGFFVRITTGAHGIPAGSHPIMFIYGNTGTGPNLINGPWTINQINTTTIDLQGTLYGAGGFSVNGNVVYA